jgi:cytochrome c oxidase cbb3-type subunit 1
VDGLRAGLTPRQDEERSFMTAAETGPTNTLQSVVYDDSIVRKFTRATVIWGLVGMTVGLLIALQLTWPALNNLPFLGEDLQQLLAFRRVRHLHTDAVIFAVNFFATIARRRE